MASICDLPTEMLMEIFIKNKLTITDATNLFDAVRDVDEDFAERIWNGIIKPFRVAMFDYHLNFCETFNPYADPDWKIPFARRTIKWKY